MSMIAPSPATAAADRLGVAGSLVCALHCALLPVGISLAPTLGALGVGVVDLDQAFVMFASALGIFTLSLGYRKHRALKALALLVPGLLMLWLGAFTTLHDHSLLHALLMTLGGLLIAAAHVANLRLSHGSVLGRPAQTAEGVA